MGLKGAFDWVSWIMFLLFTGYTEEEISQMSDKEFAFNKRVYDVSMILAMFGAMTWGGAMVYEKISMTNLGYIPANVIQYAPLLVMVVIIIFLVYADHIHDGVKS